MKPISFVESQVPSHKAIEEYKELFFRRFGVRLSDEDATEQAGNLLRLYKAVYGNGPFFNEAEPHEKKIQP